MTKKIITMSESARLREIADILVQRGFKLEPEELRRIYKLATGRD